MGIMQASGAKDCFLLVKVHRVNFQFSLTVPVASVILTLLFWIATIWGVFHVEVEKSVFVDCISLVHKIFLKYTKSCNAQTINQPF
jgi:hypothetical protein